MQVQTRDAELHDEATFLTTIENCPMMHKEEFLHNEQLVRAMDKWWKFCQKKLLSRKLFVLQRRKKHLVYPSSPT